MAETRVSTSTGTLTLRTFALAAVAERLAGARGGSAEESFLQSQLERARGTSSWPETLAHYVRDPHPADEPLIVLAQALRLSPLEVLVTALCAAVEDDVMVGRALAYVQAPLGGSRPTMALLTAAFAETARGARVSDVLMSGAAMGSGLLTLLGEAAPLPERSVSMPLHLSLALNGRDARVPGATFDTVSAADVRLPESFRVEAVRQATGLLADPKTVLVVRTRSQAEGRAVVRAIASAMELRAVFLEADTVPGLGPWALVRGFLPVRCLDLAPADRKVLPEIAHYNGPVLVLCGPDGTVEASDGPAVSWPLPVPPAHERQTLWTSAIGNETLAHELARDHRHGTGRIFHLGNLARHHALLNGRAHAEREDVIDASWTGEGAGLDALAQPIRQVIPDDALVTTPALRDQLELLVRRCRSRDGLVHALGASLTARYQPGVRALFVGPSGTGKTLAASWLATRLGLPLYRVDLAAVTSKYIGETEKNLAQLLARAEQAEVVLLFDEADSLFGKRTDVREANDRFANAQTNYLLQRIENFDGISILTSNSRSRFDDAFSRRLDVVVEFGTPGPEERRALWMSHLGRHHRLEPRDVNQLAALADLCGGDIRNAVLTAAVLAQHAERPIEYDDLVIGIASEYRKLGRQTPLELRSRPPV